MSDKELENLKEIFKSQELTFHFNSTALNFLHPQCVYHTLWTPVTNPNKKFIVNFKLSFFFFNSKYQSYMDIFFAVFFSLIYTFIYLSISFIFTRLYLKKFHVTKRMFNILYNKNVIFNFSF